MVCVLCALAYVAIGVIIFEIYLKLSAGKNGSYTCLLGKTVIITGANAGIGYYTALDFAKRGARVILACRSKERADKAKDKIIKASGNENVVVKILDLASLKSVREFAKDINATEDRLDILVNNAGAMGLDDKLTEDGLQLMMQSNHFGAFLLTNLLITLLKKSAPSRIVNVSSVASLGAKFDINKINSYPEGHFKHVLAYCNTKLCNILFTNELAERLTGTGVTANSLHPGAVQSEIHNGIREPFQTIMNTVSKLFYKSTADGAETSIYVSVSNDVKNVSGKYFSDCNISCMQPAQTRDLYLMKKLWEKSEELVKLTAEEKQI